MKTASINELKKELATTTHGELVEMVLRLAKYKLESKELLTYLIYESHNLDTYIQSVKEFIALEFDSIPNFNPYFAKKSLRKILRLTTKYIRFTGSKQAETELLLFFCEKMKRSKIKLDSSVQLSNLYFSQLRKIEKSIDAQHEDLQYDYRRQLDALTYI